ncbi:MAG: DUF6497 family protein [Paracoccaceae bacterium]|nr:DUF6497 family protein [Paracoccaceae bacterium]
MFSYANQVLAEDVPVPSGMPVTFHDMISDEPGDELTYRFRFVAPEIGQSDRGFIEVADDMQMLCTQYALPRIAEIGPPPAHIVITLMSEPTEFGVANANVTQFFESYSPQDGTCIWEVF